MLLLGQQAYRHAMSVARDVQLEICVMRQRVHHSFMVWPVTLFAPSCVPELVRGSFLALNNSVKCFVLVWSCVSQVLYLDGKEKNVSLLVREGAGFQLEST